MSTTVEKIMNQAHLKLASVSPYIGRDILIYGYFNILLGFFLFFQKARFAGDIAILNQILNLQFWGVIFFLIGVLLLFAYHINNWSLMSKTLLVVMLITAFWWFAIVGRMILQPENNFLLFIIWSKILASKYNTYISFPPLYMREVADDD